MDFRKPDRVKPMETEYTDSCTNYVDSNSLTDERLEALEADLEFTKMRTLGNCMDCRNWKEGRESSEGSCTYSMRKTSRRAGCTFLFFPENKMEIV